MRDSSSRSLATPWWSMFVCTIKSGMDTACRVSCCRGIAVTKETLTEKSQQVLAAIDIAKGLASMVTMTLAQLLVPLEELLPLKPIEKNATESFVEVLFHACDSFFEEVVA
jgi:hypothetical protein